MRWLAGEIMTPPRAFAKRFDIPDDVYARGVLDEPDVARASWPPTSATCARLATDTGLMTAPPLRLWKRMGIDGEPSHYRGEPDRTAQLVA